MTAASHYATPAAFRRALTDRLKAAAKSGGWTIQQLQRQVAYDRLIQRLYLANGRWVVKGATALLARDIGVRGTLDIDLYLETEREAAENELRAAAATDIGDWFTFDVGRRSLTSNNAVRLPIDARIGTTTWLAFHVDLVGSDLRMTGRVDEVPPLAEGVLPYTEQHHYRAYPLVDHVADKVAATYEIHGEAGRPSTRYRDLVDLVAIVTRASVEARAQSLALRSEFGRRALQLPDHFDVPDHELWEAGYAAEARRSVLINARTVDLALAVVRPFIDPVLEGTAMGSWRPRSQRWTQS